MDNLFIVNGNELELMIINTLPYTVLVLVSQLELTFIKVACSDYFFHTNLHILIANVYIILTIMFNFVQGKRNTVFFNLIKTHQVIFDNTSICQAFYF